MGIEKNLKVVPATGNLPPGSISQRAVLYNEDGTPVDLASAANEVTSVAGVAPVDGNVPLAVSDLTFPDGWAASVVFGTHMSNSDATPVPYSQAATGITLAQRSITGTLVAAEGTQLDEVVILAQLDEKVEHANTPTAVYATDGSNNDINIVYATAATANAIVQRDAAGQVNVPATPTAAGHASAKSYVDAADALKAPLASPTFTGVPAGPTAAVATNTTQLASTAFVNAATRGKTQTVALTPVAVADATDLPTAVALANANKAAINAIIAALKA